MKKTLLFLLMISWLAVPVKAMATASVNHHSANGSRGEKVEKVFHKKLIKRYLDNRKEKVVSSIVKGKDPKMGWMVFLMIVSLLVGLAGLVMVVVQLISPVWVGWLWWGAGFMLLGLLLFILSVMVGMTAMEISFAKLK
jgi:uncharacterized membrane protein YcjF (UPF0283 family)